MAGMDANWRGAAVSSALTLLGRALIIKIAVVVIKLRVVVRHVVEFIVAALSTS
jgi:hypothetical protein